MKIQRFESLGDNCEVGFVLGSHGLSSSSLLRWSLTTIPTLTHVLTTDFENLYALDNLEPAAPKMLLDKATGLRFHSEMIRDWKFVENYRDIYPREREKVHAMLGRLRNSMSDPDTILLYKDNRNPPEHHVTQLAELIGTRCPATLLYVTPFHGIAPGSLVQKRPNLWFAGIDRLAEYATANEFSAETWGRILENADREIPVQRQEENA